jgi:putative ABC transport system permease protein
MAPRALTVYGLLLRAYPRRYRARFGDDMAEVFADRLRDARRRGVLAVAELWMRTVVDVGRHAAAERRVERRGFAPSGGYMSAFVAEFSTAVRGMVRRPGFTLAASLMLAVGLGFNTALFAVVQTVLLRPLNYSQPDRIMMLWTGRNSDGTGGVNSYADYADWKAQSHSFESLAIYNISWGTLTDGGDPEEIGGAVVSPGFFHVLRARFVLGRGIEAGDELVGLEAGRPIVIAASLWQRRFASDPSIVGKSITVGNRARVVVGVLAPEFVHPEPFFPELAEYWSPLPVTDPMKTAHGNHYLRVIGRLKDGVAPATAQAEMDQIGRQLMKQYPTTNHASVVVANLHDELVGDTRPLLWMFSGALVLVLSLAVANIVNLLLARASRRRAELAIRSALGASRARLMGLLVAESVTTGLLGGVIGLAFAEIGIRLLLAYGTVNAPGVEHTRIDGSVLAFAMALSIGTGALCGVLPAWRVGRTRFASSFSDVRGSAGLDVSRARMWLVAGEMALALPLLVGAALLTQTLIRELGVDPGFDPARALHFRVTLGGQQYERPEARAAFFTELTTTLAALPGVEASGAVSSLPLHGLNNTAGTITYEQEDGSLKQTGVGFRSATAGYFRALAIPLRQGRLFTESDSDVHTVVINERAASALWGAANPLGRRLRFGEVSDPPDKSPWLTVVGVVGDVRHDMLVRPPIPEIFQPYLANPWTTMTLVTRTSGDPASLAPGARSVVRDLDPRLAVVGLAPMSGLVDHQLARPRFGVVCATIFGALGLALAAFGTFAVLSVLVAQRTREIGIRVALGADPARVRRLILRDSLVPATAGCVVGGGLAAWTARGLSAQLFGVTPGDPATFAVVVVTLLIVTMAASWWPVRRAMAVDPVTALRTD